MNNFELRVNKDTPNIAYLALPAHPGIGTHGAVKKTLCLAEFISGYQGAEVNLDFDEFGELIGIEILS
ncbi:DUF2283 domain-containing protein [Hoeflea sp. TYP-13]|uniref:DUF2283 domain-containing protein n=1 Tax=Hoeflea sp. TYP-13 TaxID=3230023 RepID=UPI0034C675B4